MSEQRITIYTPDSLLTNPFKMVREMLRDLADSQELAWRLTVRDLSAQYRQAFLGFLWALILPLANTVVSTLLDNDVENIRRVETKRINEAEKQLG